MIDYEDILNRNHDLYRQEVLSMYKPISKSRDCKKRHLKNHSQYTTNVFDETKFV